MTSPDRLDRTETEPDIEVGLSEILRHHITRNLRSQPISRRRLTLEHKRPPLIRACVAETIGVFFYVFPGIASVASLLTNATNPLGAAVFGSFFQIGLAFAAGIIFAIIIAAPTSGGHLNPAITICFATWKGFPWRLVPFYIFSQILGAMIAAFVVAGMYWQQISFVKEFLEANHQSQAVVSATGPAAIFASYPADGQHNHGYLFLIEFFADSFIAMVIWASIDPANFLISPQTLPFIIGLGYAAMVWGFAPITLSANMAKDVGCRIVAAVFFGGKAWTYRHYPWISVLVNIPASLFATFVYEVFLRDSLGVIGSGMAAYEHGKEGLERYLAESGFTDRVKAEMRRHGDVSGQSQSNSQDGRQGDEHVEVVGSSVKIE